MALYKEFDTRLARVEAEGNVQQWDAVLLTMAEYVYMVVSAQVILIDILARCRDEDDRLEPDDSSTNF